MYVATVTETKLSCPELQNEVFLITELKMVPQEEEQILRLSQPRPPRSWDTFKMNIVLILLFQNKI